MLQLAARVRRPSDASRCMDLGFSRLEITLPAPGGAEEVSFWAEFAARHKAAYLAHGPQEGNPTDVGHLENEYLPEVRRGIDQARGLGVELMTVHLWMDSRWLKPEVLSAKIELLDRAVEYGASKGVAVLLENLSESWPDLAQPLEAIPGLGLTLDVGHAQIMQPSNAALGIIDHLAGRIHHLHLHDNRGGQSPSDDLHLIPGRGTVPFREILARLKSEGYDRTATLELEPEELDEARQFILGLWGEV